MSAFRSSLDTVEGWMQAVLVHPAGTREGLSSPEAVSRIPAGEAAGLIRIRGGLTAADRLDIYADMYPLRMQEALADDYPALAAFLGDERFERLVRDYVADHPSTSFTLARLGDELPRFVAGWGTSRLRPLLADVARLEQAAARVFEAAETVPGLLDLESDARRLGAELILVPAPALALLRVRPAAVAVLDAALETLPFPARAGRGTAWVVFHRKDLAVERRTLETFAGHLLQSLIEGRPLGEAVAGATRTVRSGRPSPETLAAWLREWVRLGFFERTGPSGR